MQLIVCATVCTTGKQLPISLLQLSDVAITKYFTPYDDIKIDCITSTQDFSYNNTFFQYKYDINFENSTINVPVVMIYFNVIIVNLTNTSFTVGIMIAYTAAVSCRFASVGYIYKVYYQWS